MSESKILTGMRQAVAHAKGENVKVRKTFVAAPPEVNVKEIRERLRMTQSEFASTFGFTSGSIRNWEQGHRRPEGPARVLLAIIRANPDAVLNVLRPPTA